MAQRGTLKSLDDIVQALLEIKEPLDGKRFEKPGERIRDYPAEVEYIIDGEQAIVFGWIVRVYFDGNSLPFILFDRRDGLTKGQMVFFRDISKLTLYLSR